MEIVKKWIEKSEVFELLAQDRETISSTSICIVPKDEWFKNLEQDAKVNFMKEVCSEIEKNEAVRPDVSFSSDCSHREVLFDSIGIRPGDDGGNEQNGRVSEDEPVR